MDREPVVIRRGQARRFADRAVAVADHASRRPHDVVMVVPDAPLEPGRAAGRLDAADEARRGERVQRLVHGLQGYVPHPVAHTQGDGLDAEMVTVPDGLEQRHARGRDPQAGAAPLIGGARGRRRAHDTGPYRPKDESFKTANCPTLRHHFPERARALWSLDMPTITAG